MPYFVICGKPDCTNFIHAIFVAQYLSERLPNFFYKKIEMLPKDWAFCVDELNRLNKWYVTDSPVIWKEINMWGGKKYLLGGLGEFWEHVYCYYGLESLIPKSELKHLAGDNLRFFKEKVQVLAKKDLQIIGIIGAASPMTCFVIQDLLQIGGLRKSDGMLFKLYDHYQYTDSNTYQAIMDYMYHFNESNLFGNMNVVHLCETKEEVTENTDIIIHLENFKRREEEDRMAWLSRCNYRIKMLGDILHLNANMDIKIILANPGPVCFLATCLYTICSNKFKNIVAITADKGLSYMQTISEKTEIPIHRICAPPIWGFRGLNCFVDLKNMVYKADVYRPYKGSLTSLKGTTLPLGVKNAELRLMSYKIKDEQAIINDVEKKSKKLREKLNRPPIFRKVKAIVSLLKLWYAHNIGDEIISLGVISNGTFGVPRGICFSQPVKLDEDRKWVPYKNFPLMNNETRIQVRQCWVETKHCLRNQGMIGDSPPASVELEDYTEVDRYLEQVGEGGYVYQYRGPCKCGKEECQCQYLYLNLNVDPQNTAASDSPTQDED